MSQIHVAGRHPITGERFSESYGTMYAAIRRVEWLWRIEWAAKYLAARPLYQVGDFTVDVVSTLCEGVGNAS